MIRHLYISEVIAFVINKMRASDAFLLNITAFSIRVYRLSLFYVSSLPARVDIMPHYNEIVTDITNMNNNRISDRSASLYILYCFTFASASLLVFFGLLTT